MIKIIEHGKLYPEPIVFSCDWCGCVFTATKDECDTNSVPNYGYRTYYNTCACPECGLTVAVKDYTVKESYENY